MANDSLQSALERLSAIVGGNNVCRPEDEGFASYLSDETYLRGSAELVFRPGSQQEIAAIVAEINALRREYPNEAGALSLTLRGGGSGLSGAAVPASGIVLDLIRLNRVVDIDEKNQTMRAECGTILSELNAALAGTGLWYPVDPSSQTMCTLGGSIATNAAGPSSLKYGTTRQNLASLRWLSADGQIIDAGSLPVKTSMGFSLPDLLCGSEGRLGLITEATVRLTTEPSDTALVLAGFADEQAAVEFILQLRRNRLKPRSVEMLDAFSLKLVDFPVDAAGALLMIEFDGDADEVNLALAKLQNLDKTLEWVSARDENSRRQLWAKRKAITLELKKRYPFKLGEDIAVPLTELAATIATARRDATEHGVETAIWGHAGDGNLHVNYLLREELQLTKLEPLMLRLAHAATRAGGAMSGEHGLGRLKRKIAQQVLSPEYFAMQRSIKNAFDPHCLFNPALEQVI